MNKLMKSVRLGEWLLFLVMPAIIFPTFWCVATLHDWLAGDARVVSDILYGSKGRLLDQALGDWLASIPFSMFATWVIFFPIYLITGRVLQGRMAYPVFAGAAVGLLIGLLLYRLEITGGLIMSVTGGLMGVGLLLVKVIFYK